jgi:NADH-quinone oxidoreductase subunit C
MEQSLILRAVQEKFGDSVLSTHSALGEDTVTVAESSLLEVARYLKEEADPRFNVLMDVTAVDFSKRKPRFEVVYHFLALPAKARLRVKVPVGEPDPEVDTLCGLWRGANWYEREVYDMFGIKFRNHPDLRRILMYPEFEGHPLRKDYPINKRQPLIGPRD